MQWKNYRYNQTEEGIVIEAFLESDEEEIVIPEQIDGYPVVEIGAEAFSEYGAALSKITVPATVQKIGDGAFKMCMSLTELELSEGLTHIGTEAFYLTALSELTIPYTLETIEQAWEHGNIRWHVALDHPVFCSDGYGLYQNKDGQRELLVVYQPDERTSYEVLPGTTIIGENAFAGNGSLRSVRLPDTVQMIREAAFENCQTLEIIELQEGLKIIGVNAFSHCIRLREIHLPASLKKLERLALSDTFGWSDTLNGLERVTVAQGSDCYEADDCALFEKHPMGRSIVKYFGHERTYTVPEDVTQILESAFRRADFHRLVLPASLEKVEAQAFAECKQLEQIDLAETDTKLYVPRMPVYRKDEITALLYERDPQAEALAFDTTELPLKWQQFARTAIYKKQKDETVLRSHVFDYRGYDALFHTYLNLSDQCGMACCRLRYPVELKDEVREKYTAFLQEHLDAILAELAEAEDLFHLAEICELGFVHAENVENCMELFNQREKTKLLGYLMDFKAEHIGNAEFDFEL